MNVLGMVDYEVGSMAETRKFAPGDDLLEWVQKDNRRFVHAVYRVGDIDRAIKFYTECFGMKVLRKRDFPEEKYSTAALGFGLEKSHFVVELIYSDNIYMVERRSLQMVLKPIPKLDVGVCFVLRVILKATVGSSSRMASTPEPLCQIMLRVADLDLSIKFYEQALGMKLLLKYDNPRENYTMAMVGYGEMNETTVLELIYTYNVTEYTKGNGFVEVAVSTDDVYKSAAAVLLVIKELGGKIIQPPGPIPVINTKMTSFVNPDDWKIVLIDNEDFLKQLQKKE
ncbi:hypothetical protein AAG906_011663 [Vitis piasezkii]